MRYLIILQFTTGVVFTVGCRHSDKDYKISIGAPVIEISGQLNDTTFLSGQIGVISKVGKKYAISDQMANKVYILTEELSLEGVVGRSGRGPGEYMYPCGIFYENSKLFVVSSDNKLNTYVQHENEEWIFQEDISIPNFLGYPNNCIARDNFLYFSALPDHPVEKWNLQGKVLNRFGEFAFGVLERKIKHILGDKNFIYLAGVSEPVVFKYTYDGLLEATQDFYDHEVFRNSMREQEKFYQEYPKNATSTLFQDACLISDKLCVLFIDRGLNNAISERLLFIDLESLHITHVVNLKDAYSSICPSIDNQHLITHNSVMGTIEVFNIENMLN